MNRTGGGDHRGSGRFPDVGRGTAARSAAVLDPGPARGGSAGDAGVDQASVAVRASAVPVRTWTETSPQVAARALLTERARAEVCRRVGEDGASVAAVAREFGIGWGTAMAAVRAHGRARVDAPGRLGGVEVLGVDETAFQAASATRSTSFVTGIVDLTRRDRPVRLLDVVADRSASGLVSWMGQREADWRAAVTTAALAPTAATPRRCAPPCPTPCGCWMPPRSEDGYHAQSRRAHISAPTQPTQPANPQVNAPQTIKINKVAKSGTHLPAAHRAGQDQSVTRQFAMFARSHRADLHQHPRSCTRSNVSCGTQAGPATPTQPAPNSTASTTPNGPDRPHPAPTAWQPTCLIVTPHTVNRVTTRDTSRCAQPFPEHGTVTDIYYVVAGAFELNP